MLRKIANRERKIANRERKIANRERKKYGEGERWIERKIARERCI